MPRVSLVTLGCRLNQAETEAMGEALESAGFDTVPFGQPAELTLINTCTVTQSADASSRQAILRAKRVWPRTKVVVTGCFAETHREALAKMPEVARVVANGKKEEILAELSLLFPEEILAGKFAVSPDYVSPNRTHTRAFVKIQNGCEEGCTYCVIPFSRGQERSRPASEVLSEILRLEAAGYKEIVLTGVHIGKYRDEQFWLEGLVRMILAQTKTPRLRLSSIKVNEVNDRLLELFHNEERICPHFHTPIQSGCDSVLERMKRRYRTSQVRETLGRLKETRPDATIGTDLITGFPGETEEEFTAGYNFIASVPVDHMHVFPYSDRPGTAASEMTNKVDGSVKNERGEKLRQLSEKKWRAHISRFVGRELSVLFESGRAREKGVSAGVSDNYIRVTVPADEKLVNQLQRVKILSVEGKSLRGEAV
ncbi:MAG: tRNA (N(6)-L-threonylcarbamoyladenosine(37)-C(2))-methylthiotransferase MtaB [candidate division Zixibacteria bacterium]|nr:tRNA (N(6)-L-threonylcarbamoyladenosine(37)-C(2))-methylthiotransferase MtaB [candidate division Zixibacteria bacterium]